MSSRETVILVGALAAAAALFPVYLSFSGKEAHRPLAQTATPASTSPQTNHNALRAIAPYLLAIPRALIAIPSRPLSLLASSLALVSAPILIVLDKLFSLIALPFRAVLAAIRALYPLYVFCGTAVLTGVILGGLIVGWVKFILLVQEVRRNRAELEDHNQWKKRSEYVWRREEY
ncbi:unnamed protein product [Rhizoctonia solani]|uniref:Uncharacterized protein n=1 Tax=Rhizoctonia solani TaxID=456999 RepID=A0A8H2XAP8_9AGAM|nr:unnamed protein product [Rhizoctonia solani]